MIGLGLSITKAAVLGGSLIGSATSQLRGVAPYHYWDFMSNRALFAGLDIGDLDNTPGWTFARASAGYAETSAGVLVPFASGVLRRTDRGVLIEEARTNLYLNSAVGVTQSVTVAATAYTLSFRGTGTITLTGTSTAGPLVGTGANNRVTLTFTPTAGSLTLTVSGSCTNVNLEAGSFASSWIETAGASATRAADVLTVTGLTPTTNHSWFAEVSNLSDTTGSNARMLGSSTSGGSAVFWNASTNVGTFNGTVALIKGGVSNILTGRVVKAASSFSASGRALTADGLTPVTDANTWTMPSTLQFGNDAGNAAFLCGYIRRAAYFNSTVSDANLQAMTT
jgi:hypothetical protein